MCDVLEGGAFAQSLQTRGDAARVSSTCSCNGVALDATSSNGDY
jgi:hypothetical protein